MPQIVEMTCPGCGARVQINQKTCEWCHAPIVITSMSDIFSMSMPDIVRARRFQPHLSPARIAKNKFN